MQTPYKLEIESPCHENFKQFKPTNKGGFCDSCHKEVIDFTNTPKKDIIAYFSCNTNINTCGRFNKHQLKAVVNEPKRKTGLGFLTGIGLTIMSFLTIWTSNAQEPNKKPKTSTKDDGIQSVLQQNNITIKGTVITEQDGLPLPGVNIVLQGTQIGVQTNFDGYFEFPEKLKKGDVLIFSYIGLESQKVIIENKNSASQIELNLDMSEAHCIIMGKVAVKQIFKSNDN